MRVWPKANSPGFTLIELLVVIAITAALAALLLPALGRAKVAASSVNCQSNLRQIGLGTTLYVADFGAYPNGYWPAILADGRLGFWVHQLRPYVRNDWTNGLYRCPGNAVKRLAGGVEWGFTASGHPTTVIPRERDYDINADGVGGGGIGGSGVGDSYETLGPSKYVRDSEVVFPSQMLAFGDSVLTGLGWRWWLVLFQSEGVL